MADDLALLPHRQMVLMVLPISRFVLSPRVSMKYLAWSRYFFFAGHVREFDQGQLDFLVAGRALACSVQRRRR